MNYGSFQSGTEQGLHRNEQPPPTQQGAFPKGKGAVVANESRQKINDEFAPLTVDMETASIAHVCYANDIPFIAIRCVTDTEKHSGVDNFDGNCAKASSIAKDITVALLREIKKSW